MRFTGLYRTVGPQYGNFFVSPFWRQSLNVAPRFLENLWTCPRQYKTSRRWYRCEGYVVDCSTINSEKRKVQIMFVYLFFKSSEDYTNDLTHHYKVFILYRIHRQLVSLETGTETKNTIQNRVNVIVVVRVNQTLRADSLQACQPPVDCIHQLYNPVVSRQGG